MKFLQFGSSKKYIVFLHGWGASKESFLMTKNYFYDYAKLYVDFAGFGESAEPSKVFCLSDYVEELKQFLNEFDIEELVIVGHSFGGRVAIKFASIYQACYKKFKLILVDSAGIKPRFSFAKYLKIKRYKHMKKCATKNDKLKNKLNKFGSDDYKRLSSIMKQVFVKIVNEDLSAILKKIECETLIVWGKRDKETKLYMARRLHRNIKNSSLKIIDDAGHFCFLDKPHEFLIILDTFIKN